MSCTPLAVHAHDMLCYDMLYAYLLIHSFIRSFSAPHRTEVRSEDGRYSHQLRLQLHQCSNLSASENQRSSLTARSPRSSQT